MPQSYGNPTRSGVFSHLLNQNTNAGYDQNYPFSAPLQYDSGVNESDLSSHQGTRGRSKSWGRGAQLPSFLSAFGTLVNGPGCDSCRVGQGDRFFIPSYLKGSAYVQKLQEAYHVKNAAQKNTNSGHQSFVGSHSNNTSSSNLNLNSRIVPSHRGMTYDLIEKASNFENESLTPLPSKWSIHDKQAALEVLSDGTELRLSTQKSDRDREYESCAIRANNPMPPQCGLYYFEVTVLARKREELGKPEESSIGVGFSSKKVTLTRLPGWEPESWAYHGDDGDSYCCQSSGKKYGPSFRAHDIIGCGVNFRTNSAFFTKNGVNLGTAFRNIKGKFYPSVGMKKPGEHVKVNFGQSPFVFDIDGMMEREKFLIEQEIEATSTDKLVSPLGETELIQELILQFLKHDGYVETAREFAREVHFERKALSLSPETILPDFDIKEDEDASHRQRIRNAILDGDIDTALKFTYLHYPQVLKENEKVYFRLRCRRFIEMIRQAAEMQNNSANKMKAADRNIGSSYGTLNTHPMELDDYETSKNYDQMEIEDTSTSQSEQSNLIQETIKYGTELSAEFRDDPRKEVKKALEDAFALMAYQEPLNAKGVAYLLDPSGRVTVAEELNSAILQSLGKSSSSTLETLYQQTTILLEDLLREDSGSAAAFLNIDDYSIPRLGIDTWH